MFGKVPLKQAKQTPVRDQKQSTSSLIKKQVPNPKQALKTNNGLTLKTPITKQNIPQQPIKSIKIIEKKPKQPQINQKMETTSRPFKPSNKSKIVPTMPQVKQQLHPCKQCGRTFVQTALKRHQKICKKIFINKRKEFNSAKQRFASKDQLNLYKKNKGKFEEKIQNKVTSMPLWKQQSLAFRLAMKQMKGGQKTQQQLQYLQKEKKIIKSSMFKCKYCKRSFNEESGKRHETFCGQKAKDMSYKAKGK